jgi:hypothetical protein
MQLKRLYDLDVCRLLMALCLAFFAVLLAFPHSTDALLTDDLVGYWTFDGPDFSDKIYDRSSQNWVSTLENESTSTAKVMGKLGQAISFDGVDGFVQVGTSIGTDPVGVGTVTICMWINPRNWTNESVLLGNNQFRVMVLSGENTLKITSNGFGTTPGDFGVLPAANTWTHLCIVRLSGANGVSTLYLSGAQSGSSVNSGTPALGDDLFVLGAARADGSGSLAGREDDVRIYNRALSAAEIKQLYLYGQVIQKPPNNLGLVGYWSFNEGTGTIATDFSGNRNTGTTSPGMANPPTATSGWTDGKLRKAIYFDGTDDYIGVPNSSSLNPTSGITVSVWVRPDAWPAGGRYIVSKGNGTNRYALFNNSGQLDWDVHGVTEIATTLPSPGAWHHIVASYTGSGDDLYVDGVSVVNDGVLPGDPIPATTEDLYIGTKDAADNPADTFDGKIDEVRIYNRGLSASEVARLYQSGAVKINASSADLDNGSSLESGLVANWTFDGKDLTDKVYDRSGNGNNGYFINIGGSTSTSKTQGKLGQAVTFSGVVDSNNYIDIPSSGSVADNLTNMSVSAWFKTTNSTAVQDIASKSNGGGAAGWEFQMGSLGNIAFYTEDGTHEKCNFSSQGYNDGAWHHAVATLSGGGSGTITLYVDGINDTQNNCTGTGTVGSYSSSNDIWIGDNLISTPFNGRLDDVRIYNRALSPAEVQRLYKLGSVNIH